MERHVFRIGPYQIDSQVILAPMAGVTDRPFRQLCRKPRARLVLSEMGAANDELWGCRKSWLRLDHRVEIAPISELIGGGALEMMAEAARSNADNGALIIDMDMGCPA